MSVNPSSNSSLHPSFVRESLLCKSISLSLCASYFLLLPLFIFVIFVGLQRWRKQRCVSMAATTSHSDIFTFNMVALELISLLGSCLYCFGVHINQKTLLLVSFDIFFTASPGGTLFHLLTCVERYLAVVHPVTYRGLRRAAGVRIRNISIGCVWVLSFLLLALTRLSFVATMSFGFLFQIFSFTVVSFCSISALCVLIHAGPGDVDENRVRVDQSKQRAFFTIMTITAALLLRVLSSLVSALVFVSSLASYSDLCVVGSCTAWFSLPSSLVLPLLFLHRAGKLPGCKQCTESG